MDGLLIAVVATALFFDYTNGFHDAANAVATSISTRALPPNVALFGAAVLNVLGALVSMICVAVVTFVGLAGSTAGLTGMFAGNLMVWAGGLLAVTLVFGLVGFFIGKATE